MRGQSAPVSNVLVPLGAIYSSLIRRPNAPYSILTRILHVVALVTVTVQECAVVVKVTRNARTIVLITTDVETPRIYASFWYELIELLLIDNNSLLDKLPI